MCQTSYRKYAGCSCICISPEFTPCNTYLAAQSKPTPDLSAPTYLAARSKPLPDLPADPEAGLTRLNPFAHPDDSSNEPENPFTHPDDSSDELENPFAHPDDSSNDPEDSLADSEGSSNDPEDSLADSEGSSADSEDSPVDPSPKAVFERQIFWPKLLTQNFRGLNISYRHIDFVSMDVNSSMAPKGLRCWDHFASSLTHDAKGTPVLCPLCKNPDVLMIIEAWKAWEKDRSKEKKCKGKSKRKVDGKEKGNEKVVSQNRAHFGTLVANSFRKAVSSRATKSEKKCGKNSKVEEDESLVVAKSAKKEKRK